MQMSFRFGGHPPPLSTSSALAYEPKISLYLPFFYFNLPASAVRCDKQITRGRKSLHWWQVLIGKLVHITSLSFSCSLFTGRP
jgi:hypothetical protein